MSIQSNKFEHCSVLLWICYQYFHPNRHQRNMEGVMDKLPDDLISDEMPERPIILIGA